MLTNHPLQISVLVTAMVCCLSVSSFALATQNSSTEKSKPTPNASNNKKHRIHVAPPAPLLSAQGERLIQIEKLAVSNLKQAESMAVEFHQTPLEAFARYQWLKSVVNDHNYSTAIAAYIQQFPDTSWANQLTQRWSEQLESRQDWLQLISYQDQLTQGNARCSVLSAQFATGFLDNNAWLTETSTRWLNEQKSSANCTALYQKLESSQMLSDVLWQAKLKQLYDNGRIDEATRKQAQLPEALKGYHHTMLSLLSGDLAANAQRLIEQAVFAQREQDAEAFIWIIQQYLKQNAERALVVWSEGKSAFKLSETDQVKVEKQLYLQLAKLQPEQKLSWLAKIDASVHDEASLLPLLQHALKESDWQQLIQLTQQLPTDMPQEAWTYWRAKALLQTNQAVLAQPLWEKLATQRSYYGFMAADQLGKDYKLNTQQVTAEQLALAHQSALGQRLQALYEVGLKDVAWREWVYARNNQKVSTDAVPGYAQLAQSIGWHSFAVLALGKPEHWNFTTLRFATPYQDILRPKAEQHDISLAWAYGIMRRESAYAHDVKSSAGAMGLMQLMPKTAQALAPIQQLRDVYQPELNVHLGTKLLGQLKKEFNGNLVLATASYNAGGFRVRQWLKQQPALPTDQWIELIPFKETRDYVKAVLEYMLVFERKGLASQHTRLADYLLPLNTQLANAGKSCNPTEEWCL
jgi:soluble lytic murein transglycosylase